MSADILHICVKCKVDLSISHKTSKILPCLHIMCDNCILGRTVGNAKDTNLTEKQNEAISDGQDCGTVTIKDNVKKSSVVTVEQERVDNSDMTKNDIEQCNSYETKHSGFSPSDEHNHTEDITSNLHDLFYSKPIDSCDGSVDGCADGNSKQNELEVSAELASKTSHENSLSVMFDCKSNIYNDGSTGCTNDVDKTFESPSNVDAVKIIQTMNTSEPNAHGDHNDIGEHKKNKSDVNSPKTVVGLPVAVTHCPLCHEDFQYDNVMENIFVCTQVRVGIEDGGDEDRKCTGCEANLAVSFCQQCDDWLCDECISAHRIVRMTKDHKLTVLQDAIANKYDFSKRADVGMVCRVHPKENLTLFCEKCDMLTCRDCQLLQHQEHKYQFLQEAADSYKAKLTGSLSLMRDRCDVLKRYQQEIEERLAKVKKEKSDIQSDIFHQADAIVKAVRAAVWQVVSSLHSFSDAAAKRLSREVSDVGDLVENFDHCINFMDGILHDGYGLPLLFCKSLVETKCRKVYHTHMEPQSLKGQLSIQYRHDIPGIMRSLSCIGAIYVNGTKYPPDKSSTNVSASGSICGVASLSSGSYRMSNAASANAIGSGLMSAQIPHHIPPPDRSSIYMQMMMNRQPQHVINSSSVQGQTLSLPGGQRRLGAGLQAPVSNSRAWVQGLGLPNVPVSQMMPGGQAMMASRGGLPHFPPMRLHHRPTDQPHLPPPMMLRTSPLCLPHSSHTMAMASHHLPAPPPLRLASGKGQYRGDAEALHLNTGGQAAMSVHRRPGSIVNSSPDPARPASGGHITPERPLSVEGSLMSLAEQITDGGRAKDMMSVFGFNETLDQLAVANSVHWYDHVLRREDGDVIWSSEEREDMEESSCGGKCEGWFEQDLQRNLDEVIRGVPLDLGDNLEQINGGESLGFHDNGSTVSHNATSRLPLSLPLPLPPPSSVIPPNASSNMVEPPASVVAPDVHPCRTDDHSARISCWREIAANIDYCGHQVKGYTTGNSMPGFSLAAIGLVDPNDDYCAACHQGGDVLCCDRCPRVFHLQCHVPMLTVVPSGIFVCTLCEGGLVLEGDTDVESATTGKRKAPTGLSDKDLRVGERVLLELFCHPSSIPFHEPVNRAVPNYYRIIASPMDFSNIKCKLSRTHFNHYSCVENFLDDCKLVFRNCSIYNADTSEVGKAGQIVHKTFFELIDKHMPAYSRYIHQNDPVEPDSRLEHDRKRCRSSTSPVSAADANGKPEEILHHPA